ncbi:MAG: alkaline phosphatase family protein [Bacillota bacterium]|nr:alkaline phosphatase family protein [Bacillota bacterium]
MKKYLLLPLLAVLPLLGACGQTAEFAVIDGAAATDGVITVEQRELALSAVYPEIKTADIYTADGRIIDAQAAEVTLSRDGCLSVGDDSYDAVIGLLLDPPPAANTDVYAMARERLQAGEQVLILYLDGLGWDTWIYGLEQGLTPHLAALNAQQAAACWPSITPVNYAAMVSGQTPAASGVKQRGDRQLNAPTLFEHAAEQGLSAAVIEGAAQILELGVTQELNPDDDGDGDTDDEVLAAALAAMAEREYDLLFVHFHGIDDVEHQYGPHSDQAYAKLAATDAMAGQLLAAWPGAVIVCSDHGQHPTEDGGGHGDFRASDILVPLLND